MNLEQRAAHKFNSRVPRERDSRLWWNCVAGLTVGILSIGGFAYAAQQHFGAHECSRRNVEMQRQIERLRAERQQLLAKREVALSPAQLKKQAQKIGMQTPVAAQIGLPENEAPAYEMAEDETAHGQNIAFDGKTKN